MCVCCVDIHVYTCTRSACIPTQGFKGHQLHDVLTDPGQADLTADVDFGALSRASQAEGSIRLMDTSHDLEIHSPQVLDMLDP